MSKNLVRPKSISGFAEYLPAEQRAAQQLQDKIRRQFELYGFTPMETPAVERLEVLLAKGGVAQWFVQHLGLEPVLQFVLGIPGVGGSTLSTSHLGRFMVFVYIWLPFMILPIQASLERLPPSLLQASADLGAKPRQTFMQVILPLSVPGIAAGSIFTFSLTLGDFIVPQLVGPPGYFVGSMVYAQQGAIGNMPMAAAFTLVPIVLIAVYLSIVKRLGAFDAL